MVLAVKEPLWRRRNGNQPEPRSFLICSEKAARPGALRGILQLSGLMSFTSSGRMKFYISNNNFFMQLRLQVRAADGTFPTALR